VLAKGQHPVRLQLRGNCVRSSWVHCVLSQPDPNPKGLEERARARNGLFDALVLGAVGNPPYPFAILKKRGACS
jgi:hypothetical protein